MDVVSSYKLAADSGHCQLTARPRHCETELIRGIANEMNGGGKQMLDTQLLALGVARSLLQASHGEKQEFTNDDRYLGQQRWIWRSCKK